MGSNERGSKDGLEGHSVTSRCLSGLGLGDRGVTQDHSKGCVLIPWVSGGPAAWPGTPG